MSDELTQIENNIRKITASGFGKKYNIALELSNIEEIPIKSFEELQELMRAGKAIMRQYHLDVSTVIFNIISTKSEKRKFTFFSSLTFLLPIAGIILGFIFSWWFLLLFFAPIVTIRFGKMIYLNALFNRAANSEVAFCFLFCGNYINLELPIHGIVERTFQQQH